MLRSISVISLLLLVCVISNALDLSFQYTEDWSDSTNINTSFTIHSSKDWNNVNPQYIHRSTDAEEYANNVEYGYSTNYWRVSHSMGFTYSITPEQWTEINYYNLHITIYWECLEYASHTGWVQYNGFGGIAHKQLIPGDPLSISSTYNGSMDIGIIDLTGGADFNDGEHFRYIWRIEGDSNPATTVAEYIGPWITFNKITETSTPTATNTPTSTFTNTPTSTYTFTPTATNTPVPNTPTATRTWYYVPTNTTAPPTNTPITPVPTSTVAPTATKTFTPTATPVPGVLEITNKHIGETIVPGSVHYIYSEGQHLLSLDRGYFPVYSDLSFRVNPGSYTITKAEVTWVLYTNGIIFSNGTEELAVTSPMGGWHYFVPDVETNPSTDTLLDGRSACIRWYVSITLSDESKLLSNTDTVNIILEKGFGYPTPTPITPVPTKTNTPVVTPSWTPTVPTPTVATPSPTPIPPTNTPVTPSPTGTQVPPTNTVPPAATNTNTPIPATSTPVPTNTFTHTPTNTPTYTQVPMPQPTNTPQSSGIITITSYTGATGAYNDAVDAPEFLGYSNTFPVNLSRSGYMVDPQYDKYFDPPYYDTEHIHTDYIDFDNRFHIGVHFQFTIQNTGSVPWDWVVTQLWRSTSLNPDVFTQVFTAYNPLGNCPTCGNGVTGIPVGHTHYYDLQARLRYESTAAGNTQRFQFLVSNGISTQELFDSGKILFSSTVTPTPTATYTPTPTNTPTFTPIPTPTRTPVPLAPLGLKLDNKLYFLVRKAN